MLDICRGHRLERSTGLNPCLQATRDDFGGAVLLFKLPRNANAGGVARARAVEIDLAFRRHEFAEGLKLFAQPVGLDADGVLDALSGRIVVAMRANIGDDYDLIV